MTTSTRGPRVVSLLPAATEILAHLGAIDLLVGRTHECDHPHAVRALPAVTAVGPWAQSLDLSGPSADPAAIHTAAQHATGPLFPIDRHRLAQLAPDLILTQGLCAACAVDGRDIASLAADLPSHPTVLDLSPQTFESVLDDILRVADAIGRPNAGIDAVVALRERMYKAEEHVNPFADGITTAFLEWTDPLFVAGHWTVQLLERAGARHPWNPTVPKPTAGAAMGPQLAERLAPKGHAITPAALAEHDPARLIIAPCGLSLDAAHAAANTLHAQPWFASLPAVRHARVALVDGNQMFNRPGPRLVDAFEWLVAWLHDIPSLIPPAFPWKPWR